MTYTFVNNKNVSDDILIAFNYYREISHKLALEFIYRIREAKKDIENQPYGYEIKYKEVRTLMLRQFPYHVHYIINEAQKQIVILAVIHTYKRPKDFSKRKI